MEREYKSSEGVDERNDKVNRRGEEARLQSGGMEDMWPLSGGFGILI